MISSRVFLKGIRVSIVLLVFNISAILCSYSQDAEKAYIKTDEKFKEWDAAYKQGKALLGKTSADALLKISPSLQKEITGEETPALLKAGLEIKAGASVFIIDLGFDASIKEKVNGITDRSQRKIETVRLLQEQAAIAQKPVIEYLDELKSQGYVASYQPLWINNQIAVEGNYESVIKLAELKSVIALRANRLVKPGKMDLGKTQAALNEIDKSETKKDSALSEDNWNISKIGADKVWNEFGKYGDGIVVGIIDSGADWEHPALQSKYRGYDVGTTQTLINHSRNWFEPNGTLYSSGDFGVSVTQTPSDLYEPYSGTFNLGIILGEGSLTNQKIGIAPKAKWTACTPKRLNWSKNISDDVTLHKCFQYMLAPTNQTGALSSAEPAKAPDILNCSFSGTIGGDTTFQSDIQALTAAGIIVICAAGDTGDAEGTILSPASFAETIAVGVSDINDNIWQYSARGPSFWSDVKPDVVAPGIDIMSSVPTSAGSYAISNSGSGAAAAHVSGLAALLWSVNPSLTPEEIYFAITRTAADFGDAGFDTIWGYGRADAYNAVRLISDNARLTGSVYDSSDQTIKIFGAKVEGIDLSDMKTKFSATTDSEGNYTIHAPEGIYQVTVSSFGFTQTILPQIHLFKNIFFKKDIPMTKIAVKKLSGTVKDLNTNATLVADIKVVGLNFAMTTAGDGKYSFNLPPGTYSVKASVPGHKSLIQSVTITTLNKTLDFKLPSSPKYLLIDADHFLGWQEGWPAISYYKWTMDQIGYPYEVLQIDGTWDIPTLEKLKIYDTIIWIQSTSSPSAITANAVLESYLADGGKIIFAGEEIAKGEAGKPLGDTYLKYEYISENLFASKILGRNIISGEDFTFSGPYVGAKGRGTPIDFKPDAVIPADSLCVPIFNYSNNTNLAAGIRIQPCGGGYKAALLCVGLESIAPRDKIPQMFEKILDWMKAPSSANSFIVSPGLQQGNGVIRTIYTYNETIVNSGTASDTFTFAVSQNAWKTTIVDAASQIEIANTGVLAPCASKNIQIKVEIPGDASLLSNDSVKITIKSLANQSVTEDIYLTTFAFIDWQSSFLWDNTRYAFMSCAVSDKDFYIFGGNNSISNLVEKKTLKYSAGSGLSEISDMPNPVSNSAAVLIDNKIYIPGGYNPDTKSSTDSLTIYDLLQKSYYYGKSLPTALHGMAAAGCDGKLYVFGGVANNADETDKTYMYDPKQDIWTIKKSMTGGARAFMSAEQINGLIYVAGGYPLLDRVECYDPKTDSWTTTKVMNSGRRSFPLIARDGFLYAVGGADELWHGISSVERYNPITNIWTDLYPLTNTERGGCGAAINQGNLIVFGGIGDSGKIATETLPFINYFSSSTISVEPQTANINDVITIKLNVKNTGGQNAPNARVYSPLPACCQFIAGSGSNGIVYDSNANMIRWSGNVDSNSSSILSYQTKIIAPSATGVNIPLKMSVESDNFAASIIKGSFIVNGPILTSSKKEVDKKLAKDDETLMYTITLENRSFTDDAVLTLTDPIPANTTFVSGTITGGATYNSANNSIEWEGTLPKGESGPPVMQITDTDIQSEPYIWDDITLGNYIDFGNFSDGGKILPIGFSINYFGTEYENVGISVNGYLQFGGSVSDLMKYANRAIPSSATDTPHNIVAVFWDDLKVSPAKSDFVRYKLKGDAPNRKFIIQWRVHHEDDSSSANAPYEFQAVISENSQWVKCYYKTMTSSQGNGSSATVGFENQNGQYGMSYLFNGQPSVNLTHNSLAVAMYQQPPGSFSSATLSFNVTTDSGIACEKIINEALVKETSTNVEYKLNCQTLVNAIIVSESTLTAETSQQANKAIHYTAKILNSGNYGGIINFVNPIPPQLSFDGGLTNGALYNSSQNRIEWFKSVAANSSETINFNLKVKENNFDGIIVSDTATVSTNCPSSSTTLRAETEIDSYNFTPSLFILNKTQAVRNESIKGTVYVINSGGASTWGQMNLAFPDYYEYLANSASVSVGTITYNEQTKKLIWNFTIQGYEMVTASFEGTVSLFAELNKSLPVDIVINYPPGSVNLSSSFTVSGSDISQSTFDIEESTGTPGDFLNHDLRLMNKSIAPAGFISVWIPLSPNETFVSATGGIAYDASHAVYMLGSLGANSEQNLTYKTQIKPSAPNLSQITNQAVITTDLQEIKLEDSATVLAPEIYTTKTVSMDVARWMDILDYEIYVRNYGNATAVISAKDILPEEVTFIEGSLAIESGTAKYNPDNRQITYSTSIEPDKEAVLKYSAQITSHTLTQYIENKAQVIEETTQKSFDLTARTELKWLYDFNWGPDGWLAYNTPNIFPVAQLGRIGFNFNTNSSSFGFWGSPFDTISWIPDVVYRGRFVISTNVATPETVPTIRLRTTSENFQFGTSLVVNSTLGGESSPAPSGKQYDVYFKAPNATMEDAPYLIYNFDLLAIDPGDSKYGNIYLEELEITRFQEDKLLSNPTVVKEFTFENGDEDWVFYNPSGFTAPDKIVADGAIGFKSNSNTNTFCIWQAQLDSIKVDPGKIYHALFSVRSDQSDRTIVPTFRMRLNAQNSQMIQIIDITSVAASYASPTTVPETLEMYFIPPVMQTDDPLNTISPAFDIINLSPDDSPDATLLLDNVKIETIDQPNY